MVTGEFGGHLVGQYAANTDLQWKPLVLNSVQDLDQLA